MRVYKLCKNGPERQFLIFKKGVKADSGRKFAKITTSTIAKWCLYYDGHRMYHYTACMGKIHEIFQVVVEEGVPTLVPITNSRCNTYYRVIFLGLDQDLLRESVK